MSSSPNPILSRSEESRLVFLAKQGDPGAYETLLEQFRPLLLKTVSSFTRNFSNPETERDLMSESKLGFANAVKEYRGDRGTRFGTLLRLHVRRQIVAFQRKAMKDTREISKRDGSRNEFESFVREVLNPDQFDRDGAIEKVAEAVASLPPTLHIVVVARFYDGERVVDIARKHCQGDIHAARDRFKQAFKLLREKLAA